MNSTITCALLAATIAATGCADPLDQSWARHSDAETETRPQADHRRVSRTGNEASTAPADAWPSLHALSVDDAIRIAIANSPALASAGYRVDAASGRVTQAGLYPNPSFVFDAEGLGADAGRGGETVYRLEQEIVLGDKLDRARAVAQTDHRTAHAEAVAREFAIAAEVRRAYIGAVAAEARLSHLTELAELASQLASAVDATVQAGAATEPDRLRAQVAQDQAQIELQAAALDVNATRRSLALSMGIDSALNLPLTSTLEDLPALPPRDELFAAVLDANTRLSIARLAVERAQSVHRLARANSIPNLFASVGPRYSDPESETTLDFGVGIEIPLFDRNQGEIRATLAERLSAAADLRSVQLDLLSEVEQAWSDYEAATLVVTRYRDRIIPGSQRTLDLTRQAYDSGKTDYLRLLDAQQVFIASRIAYVEALQRLHESAALLHELAQLDTPWREAPHNESTTEESHP